MAASAEMSRRLAAHFPLACATGLRKRLFFEAAARFTAPPLIALPPSLSHVMAAPSRKKLAFSSLSHEAAARFTVPPLIAIPSSLCRTLQGQLQGEPLWQAFASADVFVMPSDSETLGFVVLEAMASGIPVVGANAGGIPDLIQEGENGYLVEPGDTDAFSDRIRRISDSAERRVKMGRNGRAWAESWSWEAATSVLRNLQYPLAIQNAVSHRQRVPAPFRIVQLVFLALAGFTAVSIVTFGCAIDNMVKVLQGKDITPPQLH